MDSKQFSQRTGDSGDSPPEFAVPLSRELIELLSKLGHQIQPLQKPTGPQKRMAALGIARNVLLSIIDYVDSNKSPSDPGIDRGELADLIEELKLAEQIVGRETWMGLIGVKSRFQVKQEDTYQLIGTELVGFFRRQFRMFDKLISGCRYTPIWEDAYETFLEEFAARW